MIRPGPLEIGLILVIILIVFGVGKLPQVGAAFGKTIRAFKKGQTGDEEEEEAKAKELAEKKKKRQMARKKAAKKTAEAKVEAEAAAEAKPEATEEKV
jgi:sec-independent protein translocase protein TatA